jgi:hypothetical protein
LDPTWLTGTQGCTDYVWRAKELNHGYADSRITRDVSSVHEKSATGAATPAATMKKQVENWKMISDLLAVVVVLLLRLSL